MFPGEAPQSDGNQLSSRSQVPLPSLPWFAKAEGSPSDDRVVLRLIIWS